MGKHNPFEEGPTVDRLVEQNINEIRTAIDDGLADWFDATFFESLELQFLERGQLSPKQVASIDRIHEMFADKGYL